MPDNCLTGMSPDRYFALRAQHKYSTANFKISHRKLNMLARQISGKPIDHAILQMEFSQKRAAKRVKSALVLARQHAVEYKGLDRVKLVVGAVIRFHAGEHSLNSFDL
jgi:large subunit ribosomal protein L22